ncbi:MAG: sialidase family protein, partial [Dokdonella sp.]
MSNRNRPGIWMTITGVTALLLVAALAACGGGGGSSSNSPPAPTPTPTPTPTPPPALDPQYRASATSTFAANCDGAAQTGVVNTNAEVESSVAVNPANTQNLIGIWQQDRWSNGGARGLVTGFSTDGGRTWARRVMPFSRCGGGTVANGGDYERATDPWVSISPNGTAHQTALSFSGASLQPGSDNAILVNRSTDGGATWGPTITLIRDGGDFFSDKNTITANPNDSRFVYAVWDRLTLNNEGPTYFSRSVDGGVSWEAARPIYDPGLNNQTIGNVIAVSPNGTLVNLFMNLAGINNNMFTMAVTVIRSTDNGATWSAPIRVANVLSVGTRDPESNTPVRDSSLVPQIAVAPNGNFFVVWQDSRFSGGVIDGIALSQSSDGGITWSAPMQVNSTPAVPAFSPFVHVRGDGMIGVSYFDFRSNTTLATTLPTDHRLARSTNATNWQDSRVALFDLAFAARSTATNTSAFFIGDYHAMTSIGNVFVPFFVQTNSDTNNRSDVFSAPTISVTNIAAITE